jgi:mono/diheme cytochrome c family protein
MTRARSLAGAVCIGVVASFASGVVLAQQSSFDLGKREYGLHCAVCHGLTGKGDGPYNQTRTRATDLTILTKANKGMFPFQRVWEVIDGRQEVEAHGTRDMPIWGTYFEAIDSADTSRSYNPEPYVRTRVMALTDYIYQFQAK